MKNYDSKFVTRRVVTNFLDELSHRTRLGMVVFDKDARLVEPLAEKKGNRSRARFIESLEKVNYTGQFTNIPAAIERAVYELKKNGRKKADKVIIFLTDGIVDTGNRRRDKEKENWLREELTQESRQAGIRIFGIAFAEKADAHLVRTLALRTNGEYFIASKVKEIPGIFAQIIHYAENPTSVLQPPLQRAKVLAKTKKAAEQLPSESFYSIQGQQPWKFVLPLAVLTFSLVFLLTIGSLKFFVIRGEDFAQAQSEAAAQHVEYDVLSIPAMTEAKLFDVNQICDEESSELTLSKSKQRIRISGTCA